MWITCRRVVGAIILCCLLIGLPLAHADNPQPIECPQTHAHVWDRDQCPRIGSNGPFSLPGTGGGGGSGGLLGLVGKVLGGLGL